MHETDSALASIIKYYLESCWLLSFTGETNKRLELSDSDPLICKVETTYCFYIKTYFINTVEQKFCIFTSSIKFYSVNNRKTNLTVLYLLWSCSKCFSYVLDGLLLISLLIICQLLSLPLQIFSTEKCSSFHSTSVLNENVLLHSLAYSCFYMSSVFRIVASIP